MKKLEHNRLAEGEVTGHAHRASEGTELYELSDSELLAANLEAWYASHEEHKEVYLPVHEHTPTPSANYIRRIVREYDHVAESARNVMD